VISHITDGSRLDPSVVHENWSEWFARPVEAKRCDVGVISESPSFSRDNVDLFVWFECRFERLPDLRVLS